MQILRTRQGPVRAGDTRHRSRGRDRRQRRGRPGTGRQTEFGLRRASTPPPLAGARQPKPTWWLLARRELGQTAANGGYCRRSPGSGNNTDNKFKLILADAAVGSFFLQRDNLSWH